MVAVDVVVDAVVGDVARWRRGGGRGRRCRRVCG